MEAGARRLLADLYAVEDEPRPWSTRFRVLALALLTSFALVYAWTCASGVNETMRQREIDNRFNFHPADAVQQKEHDNARAMVRALANNLNTHLPDNYEKEQALARLQEVLFWSNASIARPVPGGRPPAFDVIHTDPDEPTNPGVTPWSKDGQ